MDAAELKRLTGEVLELKAHARDCAGVLADIGERLERVKAGLAYGEWIPWLEKSVGFTRQTATHYMRLARLRREDPAAFDAVSLRASNLEKRFPSSPRPRKCPPIVAATKEEFAKAATGRVWEAAAEVARIGQVAGAGGGGGAAPGRPAVAGVRDGDQRGRSLRAPFRGRNVLPPASDGHLFHG